MNLGFLQGMLQSSHDHESEAGSPPINAIFFVGALLNGLYALIKIVLVVKDDINNNVALFVTSLVAACVSGLYAIWWSIDFLSNFIGLLQGNL